jgi:hypothetical protein
MHDAFFFADRARQWLGVLGAIGLFLIFLLLFSKAWTAIWHSSSAECFNRAIGDCRKL